MALIRALHPYVSALPIHARRAVRCLLARCIVLIGILVVAPWAGAHASEPDGSLTFTRIDAVRAQPLDRQTGTAIEREQPPASGWVPVSLPDLWSTRWPGFDGVVWYRLTWHQARADTPVALMLDYLNMAGAIYLNGTLLSRDRQLAEPLSRMWNTPRYLVLPAALLHDGDNTLLFRVSGFAQYQAGLGSATIGEPDAMLARYARADRVRNSMQSFSITISATLGAFFLSMWLMRRKESVHGWFGVMSLTWWFVGFNQVATSPWPLPSTDAWERSTPIAFVFYAVLYTVFLLRFCRLRWPRYERTLWSSAAAGSVALLFTSHPHLNDVAQWLYGVSGLLFFATSLAYIVFAWRRGGIEHRILSACVIVYCAAGVHDLLTLLTVLTDNIYYTALTSQLQLVGMALVLGWNHLTNLRRIEGFNEELNQTVDATRRELTQTLQRQHALEVAHVRLGERLSFAHDLHDGLGGALVSSITALERTPHAIPPPRFLSILKELRDDLRLIIDSATSEQYGDTTLEDLLVPLRHRFTRLFEAQGVECRWHLSGLEQRTLPSSQSLDVMRVLQEALTNAFKHSRANCVEIAIHHERAGLRLTVRDNGVGFASFDETSHLGTGMSSMRTRAQRLGGTLDLQSAPGATVVTLWMPANRDGDATISSADTTAF